MSEYPQPKDEHWQPPMPEPLISPDTPLFPNRPTLQNVVQEGNTPAISRKARPPMRQQPKMPEPQQRPQMQPRQSQPQQRQPRTYLIQRRRVSSNSTVGCASVFIFLVIILPMLFMISSGVNSCMSSSSPSATSSLSDYPPTSVGISFTVGGLTTTLLSIHVLSTAPEGASPPQFGDEYIVVTIKLVNNGHGKVEYSAYDFHAMSGPEKVSDAQVLPSASVANQIMDGGELSVGSSRTGAMVFQVPVGDHNARLTWKPIFKDSTRAYSWSLGL